MSIAILLVAAGLVVGCDNQSDPQTSTAAPAKTTQSPRSTANVAAEPVPAEPKVSTIKLTVRSPLSQFATLKQRLALPDTTTEDYDLSAYEFILVTPAKYNLAKPMGVLLLLNYKTTDGPPDAVLQQLSDANMAFIVCKQLPDAWWQRIGLGLDAVHHLKLKYKVDPTRVYVLGGADFLGPDGKPPSTTLRAGFNFPDVFTGIISNSVAHYMPVRAATGGSYRATLPKPANAQLALARQSPLIFGADDAKDDYTNRVASAFRSDGFTDVTVMKIDREQFHYPVYTTDWLPQVISFLDQANAKRRVKPTTTPPATTRPATRSSTQATR